MESKYPLSCFNSPNNLICRLRWIAKNLILLQILPDWRVKFIRNRERKKNTFKRFSNFRNAVSTHSPWRRIIPAIGQETNADFRLRDEKLATKLVSNVSLLIVRLNCTLSQCTTIEPCPFLYFTTLSLLLFLFLQFNSSVSFSKEEEDSNRERISSDALKNSNKSRCRARA